jgi:hypothetical protein
MVCNIKYKKMTEEQAFKIIKQVIDTSVASGVFKNAESVSAALNAFELIKKIQISNSKIAN